MKRDQQGRVAVVSGGAGGIGQACARRLAEDGADVVIVDLKSTQETVQLVESLGRRALGVTCDITDPAQVALLGEQVREQFGRCDILLNNAGIYTNVPFAQLTYETWRRYMSLNVDGAFLLAKAFVPGMMQRRWGRVINMASNSFYLVAPPGLMAYIATKGALVGLTRGLANECGEAGVTVNSLAPGPTVTSRVMQSFAEQSGSSERSVFDAFMAGLVQSQAIKRAATPEDIVGTLSFLASEDAAFITGQSILIDGGWARV